MLNDITKSLVDIAIIVLVTVGAQGCYTLMGYIKSHTRNKNLQLALTWGQQAVLVAESFAGDGMQQKETANRDLQKRINANGLGSHFSAQQIDAIVQQAFAMTKQAGLLDQVKQSTQVMTGGPLNPKVGGAK